MALSPRPGSPVPLCVDLDGTLLRSDVLIESLSRLLARNPLYLLRIPLWIAGGRPRLKREVSRRVELDPAILPYNPELLTYLSEERKSGRRILLVTAADPVPAQAVARHLALFDEVIATRAAINLKGRHKRAELIRRFGEGGFDYAGNSSADLPVWSGARKAIVVHAPASVVRKMNGDESTMVLDAPVSRAASLLRVIRVRQWVKNLLIFLPTILAHRYLEPTPVLASVIAFFSFSLGASAVYVLNDVYDVDADRLHPVKRRRPFASGDLPLGYAAVLVPVLALISLAMALTLPREFAFVLLLYFGVTTLYSIKLKQIALIDVLVLAGLYTVRIIAGSAATAIPISEWLLAFSMFLFLSLGAVKRYAEIRRIREQGDSDKIERRGYFASDHHLVTQMGLSSGYIAVLVLALYITSDTVAHLYSRPHLLWFACVLLLYWISRIWLLAHRGEIEDDPLTFAIRDPATWGVVFIGAGLMLFASRSL